MEDCGGVTIKFPTAESKSDKVKEAKSSQHYIVKINPSNINIYVYV